MVFSSLIFLFCFLPIFLVCYFIPKNRKVRNIVLLLFSLAFYGYGEPIYLIFMILSIIVNFILAKFMDKSNNRKIWLVLAVVFDLGLLFFFKYSNFFINNINNFFNFNIKFLSISLPIGISFYTFQSLTYIIDVYRKKTPVQDSIINLGCYISAFPQLIAGPIVRYSTVNEELNERKENVEDFAIGIRRFIIGLAKKAIIANEMAYVSDSIFASSLTEAGFIGIFIGAICYALQLYYDFSGYSDMAIGLGRMLGFHYLENFNYPYIAKSITDYWRRWHISLSSFFRDYVYIPLGGNRCSIPRNIFNIMVVWLLTGFWHGADWNFIIWGLYFGIILIVEKFILKKWIDKMPSFFRHLYTLLLVLFSWIIFYFSDLSLMQEAFKSLFGFNGLGSIALLNHLQIFKVRTILVFVIAVFASTEVLSKVFKKDTVVKDVLLMILFIITIVTILASSYNPFVYFRF